MNENDLYSNNNSLLYDDSKLFLLRYTIKEYFIKLIKSKIILGSMNWIIINICEIRTYLSD